MGQSRHMRNIYKKLFLILILIVTLAALPLTLSGCGQSEDKGSADGAGQKSAKEAAQESAQETDEAQEEDQSAQDASNADKNAAQKPGGAAPEGKESAKDKKNKQEVHKVNTNIIQINTQSSIRIEGSKTIYIDPYKRTKAAHDADIILITHAHYDHFDEPSLRNVAGPDTFVVCPNSMSNDVDRLGLGRKGTAYLEPGAEIKPEGALEGITIKAVPAYNLNKNFHPKANGWVGYVIEMDGVTYYAAGDTDALPELENIDCDIAFVPVGGTYTMTAKEAAGLVNKIKPEIAVPIHYGTIVGRASDADTFAGALDKDIKVVKKVADAK